MDKIKELTLITTLILIFYGMCCLANFIAQHITMNIVKMVIYAIPVVAFVINKKIERRR